MSQRGRWSVCVYYVSSGREMDGGYKSDRRDCIDAAPTQTPTDRHTRPNDAVGSLYAYRWKSTLSGTDTMELALTSDINHSIMVALVAELL